MKALLSELYLVVEYALVEDGANVLQVEVLGKKVLAELCEGGQEIFLGGIQSGKYIVGCDVCLLKVDISVTRYNTGGLL